MRESIGEIPFAEEVQVLEQTGKIYKIRTGSNQIAYTSTENIKVVENELTGAERNLPEFLPLMPERFVNAHEYFLTFLGAEYEEVKSTLNGLTSEDILTNGEKTLTYSVYNARFNVNKENKAESISVGNIDTNIEEWDRLRDNASLLSNDNQYFYFNTEQYKIVIDLVNREATISARN
jgi:teichoic acid transport system ATP-binding protein